MATNRRWQTGDGGGDGAGAEASRQLQPQQVEGGVQPAVAAAATERQGTAAAADKAGGPPPDRVRKMGGGDATACRFRRWCGRPWRCHMEEGVLRPVGEDGLGPGRGCTRPTATMYFSGQGTDCLLQVVVW